MFGRIEEKFLEEARLLARQLAERTAHITRASDNRISSTLLIHIDPPTGGVYISPKTDAIGCQTRWGIPVKAAAGKSSTRS
jgi:hypothetical protein